MAKSIIRIEARKLRNNGLGIKTIATKLEVSSSTVSLWCRDIRLSEKQIKKLKGNAKDPYYGLRGQYILAQQNKRLEKIESLKREGIREIGNLSKRDLFISGVCLYWAEGFKKDNLVGFSNSDTRMIKIFIRWLKECCGIEKDRIKIRVGINEQYRKQALDIEKYWMRELKIESTQLQKTFFQKVIWKKVYEHPENYHGVLRIRVSKSTDLLRKINGWIEGFNEFLKFEVM